MEGDEQRTASLASPLIRDAQTEEAYAAIAVLNQGEERVQDKGYKTYEVVSEIKKQLWLAGPLVTVSLLWYSLQLISLMFVGHLGELALSGASMATSFGSVTGFSLLV